MKRKTTKLVALFSLCALCLGGYMVSQFSSGIPTTENLPVEYLYADFAIDTNNLYEVVGFADYYFIATVDEVVGTSYRNEVTLETEDGGQRKVSTPYTEYSVDVLRNIKGTLPEDESILLTKVGGVSRDEKSVVVYENDMMLEPGKTYAMTACVQQNGTLLVSGPNSCEMVENDVNTADSEVDGYSEYYANEVTYDRDRFECIYSE